MLNAGHVTRDNEGGAERGKARAFNKGKKMEKEME